MQTVIKTLSLCFLLAIGLIVSYAFLQTDVSAYDAQEADDLVSINGFVWEDYNGDGVWDGGADQGIANAGVYLIYDDGDSVFEPDGDDILINSATTTGDGAYHLETTQSGAYWLEVDASTITPGLVTVQGPESEFSPHYLVLGSSADVTVNFGFSAKGSVWGTVFYDQDMDGEQGIGEEGASGVGVCLYGDHNANQNLEDGDELLKCLFTDVQGNYVFGDLLYGDYLVVETERPGVAHSTPTILPAFVDPWLVQATDVEINIGDILLSNAGDFVFYDKNGNGRQDGDEKLGMANIPIQATSLATGEVTTAMSDGAGQYALADLMPGFYRIEAPEQTPSAQLTSASPITVELGFGASVTNLDFGYIIPTRIDLVDFTAQVRPEGVLLAWTTSMEEGEDGFRLWRAPKEAGLYQAVSPILLAANDPSGAAYRWWDTSADPAQQYWYKLEVTPGGQVFGPVVMEPGPDDSIAVFLPLLRR